MTSNDKSKEIDVTKPADADDQEFSEKQGKMLEKIATLHFEYVMEMKKKNPNFEINVETLYKSFAQSFSGVINQVLKHELTTQIGYEKYKRSESKNARNGYGKKKLRTKMGEIEINPPRDREGKFNSTIVPKRDRNGFMLENHIFRLYAAGNSTRQISEIVEEIYGFKLEKSTVSLVTSKLLIETKKFNERELENYYPFIFSDAIRIRLLVTHKVKDKIRQVGEWRTINVIMGINMAGISDVLYFEIVKEESATNWKRAYKNLKKRGVKKIKFVSCDNLTGISNAILSVYPEAKIQKCVVHMIRAANRHIPGSRRKMFCKDLKSIYTSPTIDDAWRSYLSLEKKGAQVYPKAVKVGKDNWDEITTFYAVANPIRSLIYTSNRSESFNKMFRTLTKTKGINKNKSSTLKLMFLTVNSYRLKHLEPIKDGNKISKQLDLLDNPEVESVY